MNFTKLQGAGNDFVLVEASDSERDWPALARTMCDRHFGIGADGLLLLLPSDKADFRMRIFNPDGSEAEACGNGIRCFARYVLEKGLLKSAGNHPAQMMVETLAGIRLVKLHKTVTGTRIQVAMGRPKFRPEDIPVVLTAGSMNFTRIKSMLSYRVVVDGKELDLNLVSMGNPHAVYFWQHPVAEFPLLELGPKVEHLALFPKRVNFEVANVVSQQQIEVGVWERGAGETLACGTGACAVAVAAQLRGHVGSEVDVKLPGGVLNVEWNGTGEVFLSGPAELVFTGEWKD
ncbi:MAG: diaminopimelate epimerase [Chloroflexota bacterium]|nr:diaminopimelate epimerase [Chloroflexota bacterium]